MRNWENLKKKKKWMANLSQTSISKQNIQQEVPMNLADWDEPLASSVTSAMASFSWATYPDTLIISILSRRGSGMVSITLAVQMNRIFHPIREQEGAGHFF